MQKTQIKSYLETLIEKWPSSIVCRDQVAKFTGGLVSPGSMANMDSTGHGPSEKFRVGRKVVYPVEPFVEWLAERAVPVKIKQTL